MERTRNPLIQIPTYNDSNEAKHQLCPHRTQSSFISHQTRAHDPPATCQHCQLSHLLIGEKALATIMVVIGAGIHPTLYRAIARARDSIAQALRDENKRLRPVSPPARGSTPTFTSPTSDPVRQPIEQIKTPIIGRISNNIFITSVIAIY